MELSYATLDVFSNNQLEGNPLAVVSVPPSLKEKLTQKLRQKIAAEFNLSETVILHEHEDPNSTEREVNIHTIDSELPFAGHPTIGTAFLLRNHFNLPVNTLVTKAGPISLSSINDLEGQVRAKIPHNVHIHSNTLGDVSDPKLLSSLSPIQAIREAELKAPVVTIVDGLAFVLVELPSLELLAQVERTNLNFDDLSLLDVKWRPSFVARYFYVDMGTDASGTKQLIRSRNVELSFEDPATGSAACTLASYLSLTKFKGDAEFEVTQGVEMGRKSVISVQTVVSEDSNGKGKIEELWLGGTAVVVSKGTLYL